MTNIVSQLQNPTLVLQTYCSIMLVPINEEGVESTVEKSEFPDNATT